MSYVYIYIFVAGKPQSNVDSKCRSNLAVEKFTLVDI